MSSCRVSDKPALVVAYRKAQLGSVGKACMRGVGRVGTRAWTQGQQHEPKGLRVSVAYRQEAIVIPPPRLTRTPTHLHTHTTQAATTSKRLRHQHSQEPLASSCRRTRHQ